VARIATLLRDAGRPVAILSRGYGGDTAGPLLVSDGASVLAGAEAAGDEPVALARALPGVVIAIARRRIEAGRMVEARFGPRVHVLDDGFQHLALARALDLVAVEAADLQDRPMPAGALRERPQALARADLVLVAGTGPLPDGLDPRRTLRWQRRSLGFAAADGTPRPAPQRAFVHCAIAAPERLVADLFGLGCSVVGQAFYRDHHRFRAAEVAEAARAARAAGADAVVTTEKDAVRLSWTEPAPPLLVHRIEAAIEDEGRLLERLASVARAA
jgi:tetraacyldisaccharide 4'-kinase